MSNKLSERHPELIGEWSERNQPLTVDDVSYGSNKLYWWKGTCGHEWQASAKSRSSGENCPICSGARVVEGINDLATLRPDIVAEWSSKNNPLKPFTVSIGSHKKVIWQGKCGHEWSATIKSRTVNHSGCPYCSHNIVLPGFNDLASKYPEIAIEWSDRNLPLRPDMVTPFANKKVWWKCSKGHEWNTLISTRSGGSKCPYCSGYILLKGLNDFQTQYPDLAKEWSSRNYPLTPDMVNEKSTKNVWWHCSTCGYEWKSLIRSRVRGSVCPVCAEREVSTGYNDLATTNPELVKEWDYEKNKKYNLKKLSQSSQYSVWWKCAYGHSWKARISERAIDGVSCKHCEEEYQSVFPEFLCMLYANRNGQKAILHSEEAFGLKVDVLIPELRLAIDCTKPTNKETLDAKNIKHHICSKNGYRFVEAYYNGNELEYAIEIKRVFQKALAIVDSEPEDDIKLIRERFMKWRQPIEFD